MKGHFIVTRKLVRDGYLLSEEEIRNMLEEILAMAEVDNMELVSTFKTENNVLYLIFRGRK